MRGGSIKMSEFLEALLNETTSELVISEADDYMSRLSPEQQQKALALSKKINVRDLGSIIDFGANIQEKLATFSNELAGQVHKSDTSNVRRVMSSLIEKINQINWHEINGKSKGVLAKLRPAPPLSQKLISKYQKIGVEVDYIAGRLEKESELLLAETKVLERMYELNKDFYTAISIYIAAGKDKVADIDNNILPTLQGTKDLMASEEVQDIRRFRHQLEKRVHDLHLSQQIALQKAPQIRMIQENHQMLVEKIKSSILNTIPLWKDQFIIGLALERQKQAMAMQKKVSDTTNELLLKNSEILRDNSVKVAKESERGLVDMEVLRQTGANIMTTIEEVLRIQEEGRTKRKVAEQELLKMEQQLKEFFIYKVEKTSLNRELT